MSNASPVPVRPKTGSALVFGQDFVLGREGVAHSAGAVLHEGRPVRPSATPAVDGSRSNGKGRKAKQRSRRQAAKEAGRQTPKYVLRTDVQYTMPDPSAPDPVRSSQLAALQRMMG